MNEILANNGTPDLLVQSINWRVQGHNNEARTVPIAGLFWKFASLSSSWFCDFEFENRPVFKLKWKLRLWVWEPAIFKFKRILWFWVGEPASFQTQWISRFWVLEIRQVFKLKWILRLEVREPTSFQTQTHFVILSWRTLQFSNSSEFRDSEFFRTCKFSNSSGFCDLKFENRPVFEFKWISRF